MKISISVFFTLIFFCNTNAQLSKAWDKRFGSLNGDYITSILTLNNNQLLVCGYSYGAISGDKTSANYGSSDYWIVKVDDAGTKIWDKDFGGTGGETLKAAIVTADGGFLLGGYSNSGVSGTKTEPSQGGYDYWIVKTDSAGNYQWDRRFGGTADDFLYSVSQTNSGYILAGYTSSGIGGDKSQSSWGNSDYWVVKIDNAGNKIWDKRFGGTSNDYCYSAFQTPDYGFLIGGYTTSGISGDKTQSSWGGNDYWILKIDSSGTKIWDKRFGTNQDDDCYSACSDGVDGIVLGGNSTGGINGDKTQSTKGSYDFWIVHVDGAGNKVWDADFGGQSSDDTYGNIFRSPNGNYVSTGTSYSDVSGNKTQDNLGIEQTWMVMCDSNGNFVLDRTLLTNGHEETGFSTVASDGCIVIGNNTIAGIAGDKTQNNQGSGDYFIAKYCSPSPPIANFSVPDTLICEGECISFTSLALNAQTWLWTFEGGTPLTSTLANPVVCYYTSGIYNVTLIAGNMVGFDTITFTNYVDVLPQLTSPVITQFSNVLTCNTVASEYQWFLNYISIAGATNQNYTATQSGLYAVMITNAYGCTAISPVYNFNVDAPFPNFSVSDSLICQSSCVTFSDQSANNPTAWLWIFEGGNPYSSTLQNPGNICYNLPGTYPVKLTVTNSFGQATTILSGFVTINIPPAPPAVTQSGDTIFCTTAANAYQWYYLGNEIYAATNSFYVANSSGEYTVEITDSNGCTSTSLITLQLPSPNFTADDVTLCQKFCAQYSDMSNNNPVAWQWIFEAGSPATSINKNPLICYNVPGVYDVTLITFNGVKYDTLLLYDFITVYPTPAVPTISINGDTLTCSAAYTYQWLLNSVEISGATNQTYVANQAGVYTVIIVNEDGCTSQQTIIISGIFANQNQVSSYIVFPNPGSGAFTVLSSGENKFDWLVTDVAGKIIASSANNFSFPKNKIDLSAFADGVYFLTIGDHINFTNYKIIKQH